MQAPTEAPFWLNSCVEQDSLPTFSSVVTTEDSLYVKGLINEKCVAIEKQSAGSNALSLVESDREKKLQLHLRWVRGHTDDVGNSIADELADTGTRLEAQHRWWKRVQPMGEGRKTFRKKKKLLSVQREKKTCEQDNRTQWTGAFEFSKN